MLSKEQKKAYIKKRGECCPYCGKKSVEAESWYPDSLDRVCFWKGCSKCNKTWNEIYSIVDIEDEKGK